MTNDELEELKGDLMRRICTIEDSALLQELLSVAIKRQPMVEEPAVPFSVTPNAKSNFSQNGHVAASQIDDEEYRKLCCPSSKDELNKLIDRAEDDITSGRVYTTEEIEVKKRKEMPWLFE